MTSNIHDEFEMISDGNERVARSDSALVFILHYLCFTKGSDSAMVLGLHWF